MAAKNLKQYYAKCPNCEGDNFGRGLHLVFGPSGMVEKTGDWVCLECRIKLRLDQVARAIELERKADEMRLMQEEMESLSA